MNEAEEEFAETLARDLLRVLGIGIAIDRIELTVDPRGASVSATLLLGLDVETIEATGPDVQSLYRPIVERAAAFRQRATYWQTIGPG